MCCFDKLRPFEITTTKLLIFHFAWLTQLSDFISSHVGNKLLWKLGDKYSCSWLLFPDFCYMLINFTAWNVSNLCRRVITSCFTAPMPVCMCAEPKCWSSAGEEDSDLAFRDVQPSLFPWQHDGETIIHDVPVNILFPPAVCSKRNCSTGGPGRLQAQSGSRRPLQVHPRTVTLIHCRAGKTWFHTDTVQTDTSTEAITIRTVVLFLFSPRDATNSIGHLLGLDYNLRKKK